MMPDNPCEASTSGLTIPVRPDIPCEAGTSGLTYHAKPARQARQSMSIPTINKKEPNGLRVKCHPHYFLRPKAKP